jgi:hypothetical protein
VLILPILQAMGYVYRRVFEANRLDLTSHGSEKPPLDPVKSWCRMCSGRNNGWSYNKLETKK